MSPYRSDSQQAFFHGPGAKKAGITKADIARWDKESKGKDVPKRVRHKKDDK